MKKVLVIGAVVLVVVIAGYFFYNSPSKNSKTALNTQQVSNTQQESQSLPQAEHVNDDQEQVKYVTFSDGVIEENAGKRRVLYFYASWCPTCRPADQSFHDNEAQIPEDVTLIRVNYNDPETDEQEKALAKKYGITYQHTFVQVDENGQQISIWNGGQIEELLSNLK